MRLLPGLCLLLGASLLNSWPAEAGDWPAYRHDASRSGATAEPVTLPLRLAWTHTSPFPPVPAWTAPANRDLLHRVDNLPRVDQFDLAFHPIVAEGRLYFGSSSTDTLYCLDAATGRQLWTHVTEGPIRLTPVWAEQRVYCGSDDGWLSCLEAGSGRVVWRCRPGLDARRLPGNSRMISRWPIRGGLVVQSGRAYCTAGVFPGEGVFLCAVDCRDGREIWNREMSTTAHGPMVASATRLFVPSLRGPVQAFDLLDGKPAGEAGSGGSLAVMGFDRLVTGPSEKGQISGLDRPVLAALGPARELHMTADSRGAVLASHRVLLSVDPQQKVKWTVQRQSIHSLLRAGDTLFTGGEGHIAAFHPEDGRTLWEGEVKGKVLGLAAADGALFASTDDGAVHCFKPGTQSSPVETAVFADPPADPACQTAARVLVEQSGLRQGYCLVLDSGNGHLARELVRLTELHVIGLERDSAAVAQSRANLSAARVYGQRVVVHQLDGNTADASSTEQLPYQDCSINLVVSDGYLRGGKLPVVSASEVARVLRPEGGTVLLLGSEGADRKSLEAWGAGLPGWKVEASGGTLLGTAQRGRLPGAGEWTHQYADSGNTACSGDELVRGAVELQWFGPPGPRNMVDRHNRTSAPLYQDGRLFAVGEEAITAVDAYNGTMLWRQGVPRPLRLAVSMNCGHVAAGNTAVYVAASSHCMELDAATGHSRWTFDLPESGDTEARQWAYVAVLGETLLGSAARPEKLWQTLTPDSWGLGYLDNAAVGCSRNLFAFNTRNRDRMWTYQPAQGVIVNPLIAADADRVYFVESLNPETLKVAEGRIGVKPLLEKGSRLVSLDVATGRTVWSRPVELASFQTSPFLVVAKGTILASGSKNVGSRVHYELHAFRAADGEPLWNRSFPTEDNIGGSHGEQNQHPLIVGDRVIFKAFCCKLATGVPEEGWRLPAGGCGTLSASRTLGFFRSFVVSAVDLSTRECWPVSTVCRPGCWINIIPAGGLVLVPEASSGCTCPFPVQTSFAMWPLHCPLPVIHIASAPVPEPAVRPAECRFAIRARIQFSHADPAAKIYYTLDGTWPTASSPRYTEPFDTDRATLVRAVAELPGGKRSLPVGRQFTQADKPVVVTPSRKFVTRTDVELERLEGAALLRYTLDGTSPTADSPLYRQPIELADTATLTVAYFLDGRRAGPELAERFEKVSGRIATTPPPLAPGLLYDYYEGEGWQRLPDFSALSPLRQGIAADFTPPGPQRAANYAVRFQGYLDVAADGIYIFFLRSDDGSRLQIGDTVVVDNDGLHDARGTRRAEIALSRGMHPIQVQFFNGGLQDFLSVEYQGPGIGKQPVPARDLYHAKDAEPRVTR